MTTVSAMLVMLAVIGSGFSYWFFAAGQTATAQQGTLEKNVTQLVTAGTITPASDFTVSFDQTASGRNTNGGNVNLGTGDTTDGIQIVFAQSATTAATYSGPALDPTTPADPGFSYTFKVTVTVSEDLAAYFDINLATGNTDWTKASSTDGSGNTVITFTSTTSKTFDWANDVTFSYKADKEPSDKAALDTLRTTVDGGNITVAYEATVGTVSSN